MVSLIFLHSVEPALIYRKSLFCISVTACFSCRIEFQQLVYTQQNTFSNSVETDLSAFPWKVRSRGLCVQGLKVGGMQAIANGQTMTVCNGVHGKLYWALSLTDESTDGHTKVRSKDCAESKARLIQEFEGWDLALKLVEVHLGTFLLCNA